MKEPSPFERLLERDAALTSQLTLKEQPALLRYTAIIIARSGDSWFWLLVLGLIWFFGPEGWRQKAAVMLVSVFITAIIVLVIKFSIRRRRPVGRWGGDYRRTDPHSFPSGHATRSFLLAVLALGLGPLWLGLLLVVWAPLVPLARVAMGVHYLSDVIAGSLLGIFIGMLILTFLPLYF